jgi:polyhydroxybutyrate depolymerase
MFHSLHYFCVFLFPVCICSQLSEKSIQVDGVERNYLIYLPAGISSGEKLPLVLVLHSGGGTAEGMMKMTGFNYIAEREKFVAVYPEGQKKQWRDGRIGDDLPKKYDDVKFISNLIDTIIAVYNTDPSRIFSTGISNGGFMSIYLAHKLSAKILGVAPVCANIPDNLKEGFTTEKPVSLLLINGTEDKLVKYNGGAIGFGKRSEKRGKSIPTSETISLWTKILACSSTAVEEQLPDLDKDDDCSGVKFVYSSCTENTQVVLIKITGGGHTWPMGPQYLPKALVGNVCRDFNACEIIWDFFNNLKSREN